MEEPLYSIIALLEVYPKTKRGRAKMKLYCNQNLVNPLAQIVLTNEEAEYLGPIDTPISVTKIEENKYLVIRNPTSNKTLRKTRDGKSEWTISCSGEVIEGWPTTRRVPMYFEKSRGGYIIDPLGVDPKEVGSKDPIGEQEQEPDELEEQLEEDLSRLGLEDIIEMELDSIKNSISTIAVTIGLLNEQIKNAPTNLKIELSTALVENDEENALIPKIQASFTIKYTM